jgi:hypothetical protein
MLAELEAAMRDCAAQNNFEQAAIARDIWQSLTYLQEQLQLLRDAQSAYSFVYPIASQRKKVIWNVVAGAVVVAVVRRPHDQASARRCLRLLEDTYATVTPRIPACWEDYDQVRLVSGWFRQRPEEMNCVLEPHRAMAFCRRRA